MKKIRYNLLFILSLILTLGLTSVFAGGKDEAVKKRPKNTGVLTVKTTPEPLTVKVDGQVLGMSGVDEPAEFYLAPGFHTLEIEGSNGKPYIQQIEIVRDRKNCICLKINQNVETKACPY